MGPGGPGMGPGMGPGGPGMGPGGPMGMGGGPMGMPGGPMGPNSMRPMGPGGPGGPGQCGNMMGGMMRMPGMGMYPGQPHGGPNPGDMGPNNQMFVPGAKGSPMDASQPLPPSGGYKNSSFIGPTTADPNYAQQFHNFQQQLYATNTRSNNQSFFLPK